MVQKKGFTLIELIIVIALIALLATTVILVINPVKIFREARDSQRIADIGQMNSALSLYMGTASSPSLGACSASANCYTHVLGLGASSGCGIGGVPRYTPNNATVNATTTTGIAGNNGWVPVKLSDASGGSPLSAWPVDPKASILSGVATSSYYYSYACDANSQWEFTAHMESTRYAATGGDDVETTDGGNQTNLFEVGTNVQL